MKVQPELNSMYESCITRYLNDILPTYSISNLDLNITIMKFIKSINSRNGIFNDEPAADIIFEITQEFFDFTTLKHSLGNLIKMTQDGGNKSGKYRAFKVLERLGILDVTRCSKLYLFFCDIENPDIINLTENMKLLKASTFTMVNHSLLNDIKLPADCDGAIYLCLIKCYEIIYQNSQLNVDDDQLLDKLRKISIILGLLYKIYVDINWIKISKSKAAKMKAFQVDQDREQVKNYLINAVRQFVELSDEECRIGDIDNAILSLLESEFEFIKMMELGYKYKNHTSFKEWYEDIPVKNGGDKYNKNYKFINDLMWLFHENEGQKLLSFFYNI